MFKRYGSIPLLAYTALVLTSRIAAGQAVVKLSPSCSPTSGQVDVTTINVTGSGFPSGIIQPANTTVSLQPRAGGSIVTTTATAVTTIFGSTRRVTFTIPTGVVVNSPAPFLVTVSGQTTSSTTFTTATNNHAALTVNPPATITQINPNSDSAGQTITVTITGAFTTFVQGSTQAQFGPSISVGGAPSGSFGPVTVSGPTTATVSLGIGSGAALGPVTVQVRTGVQQESLSNGFTISAPILNSTREYIYLNGRLVALEQSSQPVEAATKARVR